MKKIFIVCCISFVVLTSMAPADSYDNSGDKKTTSLLPSLSDEAPVVVYWIDSMYKRLNLDSLGLQKNIFFLACKGYEYLLNEHKLDKTSLLTICDYSQSSTNKRLYVIDLDEGKVLFNTYVSHGRNSGGEFATSFSNRPDSHKSSLGFMITGETYNGKSGYSMHLDGVEKNINDKVRTRNIVMHGSYYVNEERADEGTLMGRSYGCPAIPYAIHTEIIDEIKNGSCFFAYADDKWYTSTSKILNARVDWQLDIPSTIDSANNNMSDENSKSASMTASIQKNNKATKIQDKGYFR